MDDNPAEEDDATIAEQPEDEPTVVPHCHWYEAGVEDDLDQRLAREATEDACVLVNQAHHGNVGATAKPTDLQTREKIRKLVVGLVGKPSAGSVTVTVMPLP